MRDVHRVALAQWWRARVLVRRALGRRGHVSSPSSPSRSVLYRRRASSSGGAVVVSLSLGGNGGSPPPSAVTGNAAHPPSSSPSLLSVALAGGHRTEGVRAFRRVGPAATQDGCMSLTRGRQTGQGYGPPVDISGTCGYANVGPVPEERDTGQEARGEFLSRYLSVFASHLAILLSLCFFPGT